MREGIIRHDAETATDTCMVFWDEEGERIVLSGETVEDWWRKHREVLDMIAAPLFDDKLPYVGALRIKLFPMILTCALERPDGMSVVFGLKGHPKELLLAARAEIIKNRGGDAPGKRSGAERVEEPLDDADSVPSEPADLRDIPPLGEDYYAGADVGDNGNWEPIQGNWEPDRGNWEPDPELEAVAEPVVETEGARLLTEFSLGEQRRSPKPKREKRQRPPKGESEDEKEPDQGDLFSFCP